MKGLRITNVNSAKSRSDIFLQAWTEKWLMYLELLTFLTIYMNSFFNPILYLVRNTKYRKEISLIKTEWMAAMGMKQKIAKQEDKRANIKFTKAIEQSVVNDKSIENDKMDSSKVFNTRDSNC